jgi:hypothetical protein
MPFGLRLETTENSVNSLKIKKNNWDLKAAVVMNDVTGHMFVAYKQVPFITDADLKWCFDELPGDERGEAASTSAGPDHARTLVDGGYSPADDSPRPAVARRATAAVFAAPVATPATLASRCRVAALPS